MVMVFLATSQALAVANVIAIGCSIVLLVFLAWLLHRMATWNTSESFVQLHPDYEVDDDEAEGDNAPYEDPDWIKRTTTIIPSATDTTTIQADFSNNVPIHTTTENNAIDPFEGFPPITIPNFSDDFLYPRGVETYIMLAEHHNLLQPLKLGHDSDELVTKEDIENILEWCKNRYNAWRVVDILKTNKGLAHFSDEEFLSDSYNVVSLLEHFSLLPHIPITVLSHNTIKNTLRHVQTTPYKRSYLHRFVYPTLIPTLFAYLHWNISHVSLRTLSKELLIPYTTLRNMRDRWSYLDNGVIDFDYLNIPLGLHDCLQYLAKNTTMPIKFAPETTTA